MVGENLVTYHAAGNNSESIGVAMDFQPTVAENLGVKIDETVYKNTIIFVAALCVKYSLLPTEVYGHREQILLLQGRDKHCNTNLRKTCPGLSIDLDELLAELAKEEGEKVEEGKEKEDKKVEEAKKEEEGKKVEEAKKTKEEEGKKVEEAKKEADKAKKDLEEAIKVIKFFKSFNYPIPKIFACF